MVKGAAARVLAAAAAATAVGAGVALAASGDLDTSFDGDGLASLNLLGDDSAHALAFTPGGKILVAGSTGPMGAAKLGVSRVSPGGAADSGFNTTGFQTTGEAGEPLGAANAVARLPGGSVIIAGYSGNKVDGAPAFVAVFNADGSPDPAFGAGGVISVPLLPSGASDMAIDGSGRIVLTGGEFEAVRLLPDGSTDTGFNSTGKQMVAFPGTTNISVSAVATDSADRVLIGGKVQVAGVNQFAITRLNADGSLDTSFGTAGRVIFGFGVVGDELNDLEIAPDGKIVAGGRANTGSGTVAGILRLNADGSPDTSFNGTGSQTIDPPGADGGEAEGVAVAPDGKVVIAGTIFDLATDQDVWAGRLTADGTLDGSFGGGGTAMFNNGMGENVASAVGIDPSGRVAVAGTTDTDSDNFTPNDDFLLAVFEGDPVPGLDTEIDSGPAEGSTITTDSTEFAFLGSGAGVTGFECSVDGEPFFACTSPHSITDMLNGAHSFEVRAVNNIGTRDSTPAIRNFTVDAVLDEDPDDGDEKVTIKIKGKRIVVNRKGVAKLKLKCPTREANGPCTGKAKLKTRKKVPFKSGKAAAAAKKKKVLLGRKKYSIPAGAKQKVKIKLSKKKHRLVRRTKKARKVKVIVEVRDGAGNEAKVSKRSKLKPKSKKAN